MKTKHHERTLVLVKPDGVQRGLVGEIISRFEKKGLKIIAMKMVMPTKALAKKHYDMPKEDKQMMGERTIAAYKDRGVTVKRTPLEIADDIQNRLIRYISAGPVVAMVIEGAHAVEAVRKIRGHTNPLAADVGTITADLTIDSYFISDPDERAIRNLVHASGSTDEAEREIKLWFNTKELYNYDLAIEKILYDREWVKTREKLTKE